MPSPEEELQAASKQPQKVQLPPENVQRALQAASEPSSKPAPNAEGDRFDNAKMTVLYARLFNMHRSTVAVAKEMAAKRAVRQTVATVGYVCAVSVCWGLAVFGGSVLTVSTGGLGLVGLVAAGLIVSAVSRYRARAASVQDRLQDQKKMASYSKTPCAKLEAMLPNWKADGNPCDEADQIYVVATMLAHHLKGGSTHAEESRCYFAMRSLADIMGVGPRAIANLQKMPQEKRANTILLALRIQWKQSAT
ncbi:hypothetical protein [Rugamonas aquatica]|uniref:Uncharacterized protein n=1 Tax=Rugamonas aquatica TaxID=2743357 RepID=A0A6A7N6D3_9BURK|nr:hypothetical protein [Rugamonas aquatica]MQA40685.1 hypothetical protein [Rugamonas aquatica]